MVDTVTVFGGDGFVGRYIVQALLKAGHRVRVASRNPKRGWFLKAQANLGQIAYVAADITRPETLRHAVEGANAVINLVGILKGDFDAVHRQGAANVAAAARSAGVETLIHMSAIGADPESASDYGRTKGKGEAAIRAAFPAAVILRPSIIFGREDQFINRFAGLIRMLPVIPIIGGATKFQPVFVGDVAHAVAAIVNDPEAHAAKTYELGGPEIMTMTEVNRWIAEATGHERPMLELPDEVSGLLATMTGWLPGAPITRDQWLMLQSDNIVGVKARGLGALGIAPTPLEAVAPGWLVQYRKHGRFGVAA
jgi:NADH dehydrogenase